MCSHMAEIARSVASSLAADTQGTYAVLPPKTTPSDASAAPLEMHTDESDTAALMATVPALHSDGDGHAPRASATAVKATQVLAAVVRQVADRRTAGAAKDTAVAVRVATHDSDAEVVAEDNKTCSCPVCSDEMMARLCCVCCVCVTCGCSLCSCFEPGIAPTLRLKRAMRCGCRNGDTQSSVAMCGIMGASCWVGLRTVSCLSNWNMALLLLSDAFLALLGLSITGYLIEHAGRIDESHTCAVMFRGVVSMLCISLNLLVPSLLYLDGALSFVGLATSISATAAEVGTVVACAIVQLSGDDEDA